MAQTNYLVKVHEGYTRITPFELLKENSDGSVWVTRMNYEFDELSEQMVVKGKNECGKVLLKKHEDGYYFNEHFGTANKFYFVNRPTVWICPTELLGNSLLRYQIWLQFALKLGIKTA